MKTLATKKQPQPLKIPRLSILYFNELIRERDPYADSEIQAIDTFSSCGFELLVASSDCTNPLVKCVNILMQLAFSESIEALGRDGRVTINVDQRSWKPMEATFILRPKECCETHWLFVVSGPTAYIALPSYPNWSAHGGKGDWLFDQLVFAIGMAVPS